MSVAPSSGTFGANVINGIQNVTTSATNVTTGIFESLLGVLQHAIMWCIALLMNLITQALGQICTGIALVFQILGLNTYINQAAVAATPLWQTIEGVTNTFAMATIGRNYFSGTITFGITLFVFAVIIRGVIWLYHQGWGSD
jgi:hypothetical protein